MRIRLSGLPSVTATSQLIASVFGNQIDPEDPAIGTRGILCAHNEYAQELNEKILDILPGEKETFPSADIQHDDEENQEILYPVEYLNSISPSGLPPHKLNLKIGAIVMLLRNINISQGLSNGTRLKIVRLSQHLLSASILTGPRAGEVVLLPKIALKTDSNPSIPCSFTRCQFPIQLSFSLTINKSQGQTFDKLGIMLRVPVFAHGQLYVALSRCRTRESITVQLPSDADGITRNIVFPQALI